MVSNFAFLIRAFHDCLAWYMVLVTHQLLWVIHFQQNGANKVVRQVSDIV